MNNAAALPIQQAEEIDHYLFLLQDLVWRILNDAEEIASLKKRFGDLFKERYPTTLQLPHAYLALIAHLLKLDPLPIEPQQFPNGCALLDTLGWCASREIPAPTELAQLGALWMILGVRLKNEALVRAGLKIAVWHVHLLDGAGRPHLSVWSRASSFNPPSLLLWSHVLFLIAHRLSGEGGFKRLSEVFLHQLGQHAANLSGFPTSLLVLVPSTMPPSLTQLSHPFAEEMTVGIMKFSNPEMSFMAHVSGWNSGLFSLHKKEVAVVNGGPQVGAYDDLAQFGIHRTWGAKHRPFHEITWEKTAYHCHFKGWTKLSRLPLWLELDAKFHAGQVSVETLFQEKSAPEGEISLLLFLKCDKLIVGGKHQFESRSLERYEGKPLPLELKGSSEKMVIQSDVGQVMKVIPLAGGDHFWGADFLAAFPIDDLRKPLKLELK